MLTEIALVTKQRLAENLPTDDTQQANNELTASHRKTFIQYQDHAAPTPMIHPEQPCCEPPVLEHATNAPNKPNEFDE